MYYPLLKSQFSEFTAWQNLDPGVTGICPIARMNSPTDEKSAAKFVRDLKRWVDVSAGREIAVLGSDESIDLLVTTLGELDPSANLRLALPIELCVKHWKSIEYMDSEFGTGLIATVFPSIGIQDSPDVRHLIRNQAKMNVNLLLQLGQVSSDTAAIQETIAGFILRDLRSKGLRSAGFYAASYPVDNSGLAQGTSSELERSEWGIYQRLLQVFEGLHFSDAGPLSHIDPQKGGGGGEVTPAIRYTTENHWMVHRGERKPMSTWKSQMIELAKSIVSQDYFYGAEFSWGDSELEAIANASPDIPSSIPGNWQKLRVLELNHHFAVAARQTAGIDARSELPVAPQEAAG